MLSMYSMSSTSSWRVTTAVEVSLRLTAVSSTVSSTTGCAISKMFIGYIPKKSTPSKILKKETTGWANSMGWNKYSACTPLRLYKMPGNKALTMKHIEMQETSVQDN